MKARAVMSAAAAAVVATAAVFAARAEEKCPVAENYRGHENIEWSTSYAYGLTDKSSKLPRRRLHLQRIPGRRPQPPER